MRGTPGGEQPMELPTVGFTGSFESGTALGPNEGLLALKSASAQGVMGSSSFVKEYSAYAREPGGACCRQTPARSGAAAGACDLAGSAGWAERAEGGGRIATITRIIFMMRFRTVKLLP